MNPTFKQHLESQGKSKSTVIAYSNYALDFISYLDADNTEVENATAKEVLSYLNYLQKKGQENKTRSIRLGVIKQFFNWQIEQEKRADNPIAHLKIRGNKRQKLYPILSKQELEQLYNNYEIPTQEDPRKNRNWFTNYRLSKSRNKSVISLMIHQGLTTPEVERITLNDLKLKEGKLYIEGSRKSNERTLELKSNQIIELMEYQYTTRAELLKLQENQTNKLFLSAPTAGQQKANETLQIWKGLTKEIKEQHSKFINFKQVRTSVITHWLKSENLRQVQYKAGHRYVSSTERYLVNQTEDLQADIDQFHPI
jgi:site-specific recombinase XerD